MTDSALKIRSATRDDWQVIAEFNSRLAAETENKSLNRDILNAGVQALLANANHGRYFLAQHHHNIVGQMMHTREWSDWRNGEIWWLQSVYVLPEFRNQGVFRSLYQYVEELARNSPDVIGLRLYVENHNERAQKAYDRLGFHDAGYAVMERFFRNEV